MKNSQFLVPTNHLFEVTIANYMPLAFRKCIISSLAQFFTEKSLPKELCSIRYNGKIIEENEVLVPLDYKNGRP